MIWPIIILGVFYGFAVVLAVLEGAWVLALWGTALAVIIALAGHAMRPHGHVATSSPAVDPPPSPSSALG